MTKYLLLASLCLGAALAAPAEFDEAAELMENEGRFLYFNSSSTATSLTLLGAVILLGVIFYLGITHHTAVSAIKDIRCKFPLTAFPPIFPC